MVKAVKLERKLPEWKRDVGGERQSDTQDAQGRGREPTETTVFV